ncbi:MAG TPA: hypothetical protein VJK47_02360 [Dehalococcoidales bacterium]|nr:hypothetical protein [Dehalococcoidales bacterium]
MVEESGQEEKLPAVEKRLAEREARIAELEQAVAGKESEIASLKQEIASKETEIDSRKQGGQEMEKRLAALNNSLAQAVASYKTAVVRTNPEIIEELIIGDTIQSIDESLAKAKELVSKVRRGVESEISLAKVPAGAPERTSPDLSTLSPREKIQYAMGRK